MTLPVYIADNHEDVRYHSSPLLDTRCTKLLPVVEVPYPRKKNIGPFYRRRITLKQPFCYYTQTRTSLAKLNAQS